jgi:hypothetical protein
MWHQRNLTDRLSANRSPAANSGFKKLAVQWLIEHSTSHQHLWWLDSFVLRNRQLLKPAKRYRQGWKTPTDNKTVDNFETILRHTNNLKSNFAK